ncbi:hypothetical protein [Actinocatenispora rupis]|uniref:hypothetical protein n=1 Tax=Actinocatenispora rupis TaxID=519421 RepID=UPI00194252FC|nr:hypothetical protein [Actinocatenispora rupis]
MVSQSGTGAVSARSAGMRLCRQYARISSRVSSGKYLLSQGSAVTWGKTEPTIAAASSASNGDGGYPSGSGSGSLVRAAVQAW